MMSSPNPSRTINDKKMQEFLGKVMSDFGASLSSTLAYIGQKLGLYKALANGGPMDEKQLAESTGTNVRYIREWLINQAAGGYVEYDKETKLYSMTPEQAIALTDDDSPFYVGGGFYVVKAMAQAGPKIIEAFKNGGGMLWGDHDPDLFVGTEKFFRPGYNAQLVGSWIPAFSGLREKLEAGAIVADVGCGHGASTIIMSKAFPNSRFYGYDNHPASIQNARVRAGDAEVTDNVSFEVADAQNYPDLHYDLIAFFDCLHDMGNPVGAAKRAYETLAPDGCAMIVEPMAGNSVEENFNIIGRTYSGASTLCCTANSLALGGPGLGAVATEDALREVVMAGGFTHFQRVTETPFNRIFEARR